MTKTTPDLTQAVMSTINRRHLHIKPRWYFWVGSLLSGLSLGVIILMAVLFLSRAFFRLRHHGPFGFLLFGEFGFKPFLATFPFLWLFLAILGILVGVKILTHYDISYKKGLLSLSLILAIGSVTAAVLVDALGINDRLSQTSPLKPFYAEPDHNHSWLIGSVLESTADQLILQTPSGSLVTVTFDEQTLLPFGRAFPKGERVRVVGNWSGEIFAAQGVGRGGMRWGSPVWPTPESWPPPNFPHQR